MRKHGISFEEAVRVFADPMAVTRQARIENGEQRWQTIGAVGGFTLLLVAHTLWDDETGIERSFASSVLVVQTERNGESMKTVSVTLDDLPPLSPERIAELRTLAERPDSEIDYSDIPAQDTADWADAERGRFYRPIKTQTSIRIDKDVLAWLKRDGKGYQTRINAILREAMLRDLQQPATSQATPSAAQGERADANV